MVLASGYGGTCGGVVTSVSILKLEALTSNTPIECSGVSEHSKSEGVSKEWTEVTSLSEELLLDLQKGWLENDDVGDIVCVRHVPDMPISS